MSGTGEIINNVFFKLDLTFLLSFLMGALSILVAIVKVFGKDGKSKADSKSLDSQDINLPGKSPFCKQHDKDFYKIEEEQKEERKNIEDVRRLVNDINSQVAVLKEQNINSTKTIEEMKRDSREIAAKLDDLLKQLTELMSEMN